MCQVRQHNPKISTVIKYPEASTKLHLLALEMIDKQDLESAIKTLMVADLRSRS
jgi:hypothetical protein